MSYPDPSVAETCPTNTSRANPKHFAKFEKTQAHRRKHENHNTMKSVIDVDNESGLCSSCGKNVKFLYDADKPGTREAGISKNTYSFN